MWIIFSAGVAIFSGLLFVCLRLFFPTITFWDTFRKVAVVLVLGPVALWAILLAIVSLAIYPLVGFVMATAVEGIAYAIFGALGLRSQLDGWYIWAIMPHWFWLMLKICPGAYLYWRWNDGPEEVSSAWNGMSAWLKAKHRSRRK